MEAFHTGVFYYQKHWYEKNNIPAREREEMNGYRPNCLQAFGGYKARPLNGIWATAPFLHNGSVPTLYDLLSPASERPKKFYLGNLEFDPERVGYRTEAKKGTFKLDTSIPGNLNIGHEFRGSTGDTEGVIGRALAPGERMALIEFLKTL